VNREWDSTVGMVYGIYEPTSHPLTRRNVLVLSVSASQCASAAAAVLLGCGQQVSGHPLLVRREERE